MHRACNLCWQAALACKRELHSLRKQLAAAQLHASLIARDRAAAAAKPEQTLIEQDDASFASMEAEEDSAEERIHVLQTQVAACQSTIKHHLESKDRFLTAARLAGEASLSSMAAAANQVDGEAVSVELQALRNALADAELDVARGETALVALQADVEARRRPRDAATMQVCGGVQAGACYGSVLVIAEKLVKLQPVMDLACCTCPHCQHGVHKYCPCCMGHAACGLRYERGELGFFIWLVQAVLEAAELVKQHQAASAAAATTVTRADLRYRCLRGSAPAQVALSAAAKSASEAIQQQVQAADRVAGLMSSLAAKILEAESCVERAQRLEESGVHSAMSSALLNPEELEEKALKQKLMVNALLQKVRRRLCEGAFAPASACDRHSRSPA